MDDSEQRNIRVYDFASDGTLTNGAFRRRTWAGKDDGVPDGIKVDRAAICLSPALKESGSGPRGCSSWRRSFLPEQPANLAWGERERDVLYITATTSVYRLKTSTRGFVPGEKRAHKLPIERNGDF